MEAQQVRGSTHPGQADQDRRLVSARVDQWKKQLLDLTRRNKLLYLTQEKISRSVQISSPSLAELLASIVDREKPLSFPMSIQKQLTLGDTESGDAERPQFFVRKGDVETSLPVADLTRRLYRLRREWLTWQEEQGVHTLFIGAGLLKWKETSIPDQEFLAPIVLVPVSLERKSHDEPYIVSIVEEDIVVNPALRFKLSAEFGIDLPELPHEIDSVSIADYLQSTADPMKKMGWEVLTSVILDRFTYEKFVMYTDLANHLDEACQHPITRALAKVPLGPQETLEFPHDLDEVVNPTEVFPILDADSSQTEVLLRARHRENLVVEGPPGTGKSQTIANLIAQCLREGMKVLFVSEKMAALEVVNRRLNKSGLSFACLEVHSHHSDKSKVVQELAKTLSSTSHLEHLDASEQYSKLVRLRDRLNTYVKELHAPNGPLKLSAFQVHGRLSKIMDVPSIEFKLPSLALDIGLVQLESMLEAIGVFEHLPNVIDNLPAYPWYNVQVTLAGQPELLVVETIVRLIDSLFTSIDAMQALIQPLAEATDLAQPTSLNAVNGFIRLAKLLARPPAVLDGWLRLSNEELVQVISEVKVFQNRWDDRETIMASLKERWNEQILNMPVQQLLSRFTGNYKTPFRLLRSGFRKDKRSLIPYWKSSKPPSYAEMVTGLSSATKIQESQQWLLNNRTRAQEIMGQFYNDASTNWGLIVESVTWVASVIKSLPPGRPPTRLASIISSDPEILSRLAQDLVDTASPVLSKTSDSTTRLSTFIPDHPIEGQDFTNSQFGALKKWLAAKSNPQDLRDWLRFEYAIERSKSQGLDDFVKSAIENHVLTKKLKDAFLQRFWKIWLSETYQKSPTLSNFQATYQEEVIQEFRQVERNLREATIQVVMEKIAARQPRAISSLAKESQVAILLREAQKKRRIKPLRKLFEEIPQLIQALKPCILMSPLSVASYLGTSPYHFDIVIFDEASQIPPADAIGSILRGASLIVAGDNKQLPPTRFFQSDIETDEDEEEGLEEPLESILDECLALPAFRRTMLKWHYRSNNEALIDFSNRNFYDGDLITFPSPEPKDSLAAVELKYVNDGVYDRGGSRTNRREATVTTDLIEDHFRRYGSGITLGVITLSIAQEEAIWDEWEQRKILKPYLGSIVESNSSEPFFIKSLEKVQGDERDRIIISLGYGRDSRGVLSMNFGPINQAGGERRLNVAVTRARDHLTVVSSILPQEIDPTRLSKGSRGVGLLQKYLEYASDGGQLPAETYGGSEPESDFEYEVKEKLESRGLSVDSQVGCSDFRIDLAIRSPKNKNRYILGVECDGATYHSQRSARDRDRLRQEILEKLGWKIYRVWSTEWIRNPEKIVQDIVQRVALYGEDVGIEAQDVLDGTPDLRHNETAPNEVAEAPANDSLARAQTPINPFDLEYYRPARIIAKGRREWFYASGESQSGLRRLSAEIQAIVQNDSPIHIDAVARRIAAAYQLGRVGSTIDSIVERAIGTGVSKGMFSKRGNFLWKDDGVRPRIPVPGDSPRPLEEIAIEEIGAVMERIVEREVGISRDSLMKVTAQTLGYDRSGAKVEARMSEAVDFALAKGKFEVYNDQITLRRLQNES